MGDRIVLMDKEDFDALPSKHLNICNGYVVMRLTKSDSVDGVAFNWLATVLCHRWIMRCPDNKVVDHINRSPLDNRRSNLRVCSQGDNMVNRKMQRNNQSGYRGVLIAKPRKGGIPVYRTSVKSRRFAGAGFHGSFSDLKVAARVYDREALRAYGKFTVLNFPNEDNTNYRPPKKYVLDKRTPSSGKVGVYRSTNGKFYVQAPNGSGRNTTIGTGFETAEEGHSFRAKYLKERKYP